MMVKRILKGKVKLSRIARFFNTLSAAQFSLLFFMLEGKRSGKREFRKFKKMFNEMSLARKIELIRLAKLEKRRRIVKRIIKRRRK